MIVSGNRARNRVSFVGGQLNLSSVLGRNFIRDNDFLGQSHQLMLSLVSCNEGFDCGVVWLKLWEVWVFSKK